MSEESLGTITDAEIIEIQKEVKEIEKTVKSVAINDDGNFVANNDVELASAMARYRAMGIIPKQFETNAHAIGAYLYAKSLGLQPLAVWGQIALIHGKYCVFGSLKVALAQKDPLYGYSEVIYLDENQDKISFENKNLKAPAWACVIRTQKKGSPFITESYFTMDDAKKAGIIRNVWNSYPRDMLFWKAINRDLNLNYSAAVNAIAMYEDLKETWEEKDITPKPDLNAL